MKKSFFNSDRTALGVILGCLAAAVIFIGASVFTSCQKTQEQVAHETEVNSKLEGAQLGEYFTDIQEFNYCGHEYIVFIKHCRNSKGSFRVPSVVHNPECLLCRDNARFGALGGELDDEGYYDPEVDGVCPY